MRHARLTASVVVAALVALAGFAGGATAAAPAPGVQSTQEQTQETEGAEINVTNMEVENLSTSMELASATMMVETDEGVQEVTVDSASIELTNATVVVQNATIADGAVDLDEATVVVTDGQIEVESSQGDHSIDLSDTNETVEDETVTLEDLTGDAIDLSEDMGDATITEMTVEGISGTASKDLMILNLGATETTGDENISVVAQNADLEVENATVTLTNATIEDDTLVAESVEADVAMATFEADRVVTLRGTALDQFDNVSRTVEDASVQRSDVEVAADDIPELLDQLMGEQTAEALAG